MSSQFAKAFGDAAFCDIVAHRIDSAFPFSLFFYIQTEEGVRARPSRSSLTRPG